MDGGVRAPRCSSNPVVSYSYGGHTITFNVPIGYYYNRKPNPYTGNAGDATFPRQIFLSSYSWRFGAKKALAAPPVTTPAAPVKQPETDRQSDGEGLVLPAAAASPKCELVARRELVSNRGRRHAANERASEPTRAEWGMGAPRASVLGSPRGEAPRSDYALSPTSSARTTVSSSNAARSSRSRHVRASSGRPPRTDRIR